MDIYVVDDSRTMRMMIKSCLREAGFTGHKIIEFPDGAEALKKVVDETPDLILSDWNMPNMTGIELLGKIKELVESKELKKMIPFVFVTSESTGSMMEKALSEGANEFITKPFTADIFANKLGQFID